MSRPKDITEATELACLLGYLSQVSSAAMSYFVQGEVSAEESLQFAIRKWASSNAALDSKEDE